MKDFSKEQYFLIENLIYLINNLLNSDIISLSNFTNLKIKNQQSVFWIIIYFFILNWVKIRKYKEDKSFVYHLNKKKQYFLTSLIEKRTLLRFLDQRKQHFFRKKKIWQKFGKKILSGRDRMISFLLNKINLHFFSLFLERKNWNLKLRNKYVYRIDIINPSKIKRPIGRIYTSLRLIRLFFIDITYREFQKFGRKISKKDGLFEENFFFLLECRAVGAIYRSSFVSNLFDARRFIEQGYFWINKKFCKFFNNLISIGSFCGINPFLKGSIYWDLYRRIRSRCFIFFAHKYIWVSYKLLVFFYKRYPKKKDFINPFSLDFFRATGFLFTSNIH